MQAVHLKSMAEITENQLRVYLFERYEGNEVRLKGLKGIQGGDKVF